MTNSSNGYDALRREIEAAQKTRDEILKWKGLSVAAIGAAALGFSEHAPVDAHLALIAIPFVCAYSDLLCRNLSIRSKLVSSFLYSRASIGDVNLIAAFEKYYAEFKDRSGRALESLALVGSSAVLSIAIIPLGITVGAGGVPAGQDLMEWPNLLFIVSGILGLVAAVVVDALYQRRRDVITALAEKSAVPPA